jgi:hypothetical protein
MLTGTISKILRNNARHSKPTTMAGKNWSFVTGHLVSRSKLPAESNYEFRNKRKAARLRNVDPRSPQVTR